MIVPLTIIVDVWSAGVFQRIAQDSPTMIDRSSLLTCNYVNGEDTPSQEDSLTNLGLSYLRLP